MKDSPPEPLPLQPLLAAYRARGVPTTEQLSQIPEWGPRFEAILHARSSWLRPAFLDTASTATFAQTILRFYEAVVSPPLHAATLCRRADLVRHALGHLLLGADPLSVRIERCLAPDGPYQVAGLGLTFWSAVFQALQPQRYPAWTPGTVHGLLRLGLVTRSQRLPTAEHYAIVSEQYAALRLHAPELSSLHCDHFLSLVANLTGRDLNTAQPTRLRPGISLASLRRTSSTRTERLYKRARQEFEAALAARSGPDLRAALRRLDPVQTARKALHWKKEGETLTLWLGRLWEADDPYEVLADFWRADPLPGAGWWLPTLVLHLRQPAAFWPWTDALRQGYNELDETVAALTDPVQAYRLFNEGITWLHEGAGLDPLAAPAVLPELGTAAAIPHQTEGFTGFVRDTFDFLAALQANNRRDWMQEQRARYAFVLREPWRALCQALAERFVEPVLQRQHGWRLETTARSGRALTSICKNDYGRSTPYQDSLWITFYRRDRDSRRADVQFFVRLTAEGVRFGLNLGGDACAARQLLQTNLATWGETLFSLLNRNGILQECTFSTQDVPAPVRQPAELLAWAGQRSCRIERSIPLDDPVVLKEELVGTILLTWDRLIPLYACAVTAEPAKHFPGAAAEPRWTERDFCRETYLDADWPRQARSLLTLKRQLILQGVPGTGKTHVARSLARLLTSGREEAIRLVQFHPAYSYEEFVEGIKARTIECAGRQEVTYPVEDGVLCTFAAQAARTPEQPHVLIIDEINRGNLPRIFGELLYLLEYREQTVELPYSRRRFALPANLYVLGTMNAADRSVATIDQALRRRFSFLDMPPDAEVLARWLATHPPVEGPDFASTVVRLFRRLNANLLRDLGPRYQVGHSYFMTPELTLDRLRVIWRHHVGPLLEETFAAQPVRLKAYHLDRLLRERTRSRPATSGAQKTGSTKGR